MFQPKVPSAITMSFACVLSLSLSGCTLATTAAPGPLAGAALAGKVYGGQQPVAGAKIYLLAANPGGYGSASLSLLTSALSGNAVDPVGAYVTTNSGGYFTLPSFDCTTGYAQGASTASGGTTLPGNQQVYLYVLGGNPGLNTGVNPAIGELAALGPCNAPFAPTLQVNEITTVAAAYALAGYATDALHVSSSGSSLALTGLTNAGLNSRALANVGTGAAATNGTYSVPPTGNIITIGNILAACINGAAGNSSCNTLFQYTKTSGAGGTAATDTATAAINLAHNPFPSSAGVTALYGLVSSSPAFAGSLTSQPNDFTLGMYFQNANCFNNSAHGMAIDAAGSAWALGGHGICKFSSTGTPLTSYYGFNYGGCFSSGSNLAIDNSGNLWVPDLGFNRLCEVSNSGTAITPSAGYTGGGISSPRDVAIDAAGNIWIANLTSLSKFSSSGNAISPASGYVDGGSNDSFYGMAIDISGNVWAANYGMSSVSQFSSSGTALSPATGYYHGGIYSPYDVAIDGSGNVWTANYGNDSVSKLANNGTYISPDGPYGGYKGGGFNSPESVAIDSAGKVWAANEIANTVTVITNTGGAISGSPAYNAGSGIYAPVSLALDGSGDVWVTNGNGTLTELIGAAAPVVTPVAANLVAPYGTATVNRP